MPVVPVKTPSDAPVRADAPPESVLADQTEERAERRGGRHRADGPAIVRIRRRPGRHRAIIIDEDGYYDDGLPAVSWHRGWPSVTTEQQRTLSVLIGLAAAIGLEIAGAGTVVAVAGGWLLAFVYLLGMADALEHILPDRYVLLSTWGILGAWAVLATSEREPWLLFGPLMWAGVALIVFLALQAIPILVDAVFGGPRGGMGLGDVKLVVPLALWLGHWGGGAVLSGLTLGVILAGLWAILLLVSGRAKYTSSLAYGPWLIAGTVAASILLVTFDML